MTTRTYDVTVNANANRRLKVRASSAIEAAQTAYDRVHGSKAGSWSIDFPGDFDEHISVTLDGRSQWVETLTAWCDLCDSEFEYDPNDYETETGTSHPEACPDCLAGARDD